MIPQLAKKKKNAGDPLTLALKTAQALQRRVIELEKQVAELEALTAEERQFDC